MYKSLPTPTVLGVGYQVWLAFTLGLVLGVWLSWWIGVLAFFGTLMLYIVVYGTVDAIRLRMSRKD